MAGGSGACQGNLRRKAGGAKARPMTKDEERAARLAAQLRENLKRRKAQARGTAEAAPRETEPEGRRR